MDQISAGARAADTGPDSSGRDAAGPDGAGLDAALARAIRSLIAEASEQEQAVR